MSTTSSRALGTSTQHRGNAAIPLQIWPSFPFQPTHNIKPVSALMMFILRRECRQAERPMTQTPQRPVSTLVDRAALMIPRARYTNTSSDLGRTRYGVKFTLTVKRSPSQRGICDGPCSSRSIGGQEENQMLRWALAFFIVALIAALFGFGGIAVAAAGIAKILFFIFIVLFLLALVGGMVRRA